MARWKLVLENLENRELQLDVQWLNSRKTCENIEQFYNWILLKKKSLFNRDQK